MSDEEANCFPQACEAGLCFLEERRALGECIRALQDPKGVQVSGWGAKGRAECDRGADLCLKVSILVKLGRFIRASLLVSEEAADGLGSPPDTRDILADLFWPQVSRKGAFFGRVRCFEREHFSSLRQSIS